jgi:hypothetical protein
MQVQMLPEDDILTQQTWTMIILQDESIFQCNQSWSFVVKRTCRDNGYFVVKHTGSSRDVGYGEDNLIQNRNYNTQLNPTKALPPP